MVMRKKDLGKDPGINPGKDPGKETLEKTLDFPMCVAVRICGEPPFSPYKNNRKPQIHTVRYTAFPPQP
jgi:hypothetical protein